MLFILFLTVIFRPLTHGETCFFTSFFYIMCRHACTRNQFQAQFVVNAGEAAWQSTTLGCRRFAVYCMTTWLIERDFKTFGLGFAVKGVRAQCQIDVLFRVSAWRRFFIVTARLRLIVCKCSTSRAFGTTRLRSLMIPRALAAEIGA